MPSLACGQNVNEFLVRVSIEHDRSIKYLQTSETAHATKQRPQKICWTNYIVRFKCTCYLSTILCDWYTIANCVGKEAYHRCECAKQATIPVWMHSNNSAYRKLGMLCACISVAAVLIIDGVTASRGEKIAHTRRRFALPILNHFITIIIVDATLNVATITRCRCSVRTRMILLAHTRVFRIA